MIITLTGPNTYLLNAEFHKLRDDFLEHNSDLALEYLDGEDTNLEKIVEVANSLPFLAAQKMVILRNPSAQKQFIETIELLIKDAPDTTNLVIIETKLDKRTAYFKVLKTKTDFREFNELDVHGLSKWIVQYVQTQNGKITKTDADYLVQRVGQNQQNLANEINKLLIFEPLINRQNIDLLTEKTPQSTIFELLDAAFAGNIKLVDKLYTEQRALKVEPQQILALLAWQLHILAIVKSAGERNTEEIINDSGLNPFTVRKSMEIARNVNLTKVKKLVKQALNLDVKLKTQSIDADEALRYFLLTIF